MREFWTGLTRLTGLVGRQAERGITKFLNFTKLPNLEKELIAELQNKLVEVQEDGSALGSLSVPPIPLILSKIVYPILLIP